MASPQTKLSRRIVICPAEGKPAPDGHLRRTTVRDKKNAATIHVIGGSEKVHSANVRLAKELARLPNDDQFNERAVLTIQANRSAAG